MGQCYLVVCASCDALFLLSIYGMDSVEYRYDVISFMQ